MSETFIKQVLNSRNNCRLDAKWLELLLSPTCIPGFRQVRHAELSVLLFSFNTGLSEDLS